MRVRFGLIFDCATFVGSTSNFRVLAPSADSLRFAAPAQFRFLLGDRQAGSASSQVTEIRNTIL